MNRFTPSSLLFEEELYRQLFLSPEAKISARMVYMLSEAGAVTADDLEQMAHDWAIKQYMTLHPMKSRNAGAQEAAKSAAEHDWRKNKEDRTAAYKEHLSDIIGQQGGHELAPGETAGGAADVQPRPTLDPAVREILDKDPDLWRRIATVAATRPDLLPTTLARAGIPADQADGITAHLAQTRPGVAARLKPRPAPAPAPAPAAEPETPPAEPEAPAEPPAAAEPEVPAAPEPAAPPPQSPLAHVRATAAPPPPPASAATAATAAPEAEPPPPEAAAPPPPPTEPAARSPLQAVRDAVARERETKTAALEPKKKEEPKGETPRRLRSKQPKEEPPVPEPAAPEAPPAPPAPPEEPAVRVRASRPAPADLAPPAGAPAPAGAPPAPAPAGAPAAPAAPEPTSIPRENLGPIQQAFSRFIQLTGGRAGVRAAGEGKTAAQNIPMENVKLANVSIVPKGNDRFIMKWKVHGRTGGNLSKAADVIRNDGAAIRALDRSFED